MFYTKVVINRADKANPLFLHMNHNLKKIESCTFGGHIQDHLYSVRKS